MSDADFQTRTLLKSVQDKPGRTSVKIESLTKAGVQTEIDRLTAIVDEFGGWATFVGPGRQYNGYAASGEINVAPWVPLCK